MTFDVERAKKLKADAHNVWQTGDNYAWTRYHHFLQAAYERGDLVPAVPQSIVVEKMPMTVDRRPYEDDKSNGYLESNRDWADNNDEAVTWLANNHDAIRTAISHTSEPCHHGYGRSSNDRCLNCGASV